MTRALWPLAALFTSIAVVLIGNGIIALALPLRSAALGRESGVTGLLLGGYFVGFIVGTFLVPRLVRAVGHIRVFAALAAIGSTMALALAYSETAVVWWLLRLVQGIALVGLYLVTESWINAVTPTAHRGRVFGAYMMVTLLALAVGVVGAPWIGGGDPSLALVLAAALFSLGILPVALLPFSAPGSVTAPPAGSLVLARVAPLATVAVVASGIANGAFWSYGAQFFLAASGDARATGLFTGLVIVGGVVLQWPFGWLSDRVGRRGVLTAVAWVGGLVALYIGIALPQSRWLLGVSAFVYGGMMLSLYSLAVAHLNDQVPRERALDAARAMLLAYGLGAALGPLFVVGPMQLFGERMFALISSAVLGVVGVYGLWRRTRRAPVALEAQVPFVPMVRTSQAALEPYPEITDRSGNVEREADSRR